MTDHKPLKRFSESPYVEGIYARWNADLSVLNLDIEYISGTRNVIADALSRTIFPDPDCQPDNILLDHGNMEQSISGVTDWVWKDGVEGYAEFVAKQRERDLIAAPQDALGPELYDREDVTLVNLVSLSIEDDEVMEVYSAETDTNDYALDPWYSDIYKYISYGRYDRNIDRVQLRALLQKCTFYRIEEEIVFRLCQGKEGGVCCRRKIQKF